LVKKVWRRASDDVGGGRRNRAGANRRYRNASTNELGEDERRARKRARQGAVVGWQTVSGGLKEEKVERLQCVKRVTDDGWRGLGEKGWIWA
jgi:hypothetical protein